MSTESLVLAGKKLDFNDIIEQLNGMEPVLGNPVCGWGMRASKSVQAMHKKEKLQIEFMVEKELPNVPSVPDIGYQEDDLIVNRRVAYYQPFDTESDSKKYPPYGEILSYEEFVHKYVQEDSERLALGGIMNELDDFSRIDEDLLFSATLTLMESSVYEDDKKVLYRLRKN